VKPSTQKAAGSFASVTAAAVAATGPGRVAAATCKHCAYQQGNQQGRWQGDMKPRRVRKAGRASLVGQSKAGAQGWVGQSVSHQPLTVSALLNPITLQRC
jgi:hypothetical protein